MISGRALALDQSLSSTGFAIWRPGDHLPATGAWKLCSGVKNRAIGFAELRSHLLRLHKEDPISHIALEQPVLKSHDKLEKLVGLYGLVAIVESFAQPRGIDCEIVNVRTWRKVFLGPGYKDLTGEQCKRAAIERARFYGMRPAIDDEAEAIGILDWLLMKEKIDAPWRIKNPLAPSV